MKKTSLILLTTIAIAAVARAEVPTLWIIGDSTVRSGGKNNMYGWGETIGKYFDPAKIRVENKAIGGRSSRTFRAEGRWDGVLSGMKPGDLLLVQFGHNDQTSIGEKGKFRGSLPGTGDKMEKVTKPDNSEEEVHTFGWYMAHYATEAKDKGAATVVILSPVAHKDWDGDKPKEEFGDLRAWAAEAAKSGGALFSDLNAVVREAYAKIGRAEVDKFFADPRTHTNKDGAEFNARQVVACLKGLPGNPFGNVFSSEASDIAPATPPVPAKASK